MLVEWGPPALGFLGALGPALLARGLVPRAAARALVLAALAALLAIAVVLGMKGSGIEPFLDTLVPAALVALAAAGVSRPWAYATLGASAAAFGRAAYKVSHEVTTDALLGALFLAAAAMLAAALAAVRITRGR